MKQQDDMRELANRIPNTDADKELRLLAELLQESQALLHRADTLAARAEDPACREDDATDTLKKAAPGPE